MINFCHKVSYFDVSVAKTAPATTLRFGLRWLKASGRVSRDNQQSQQNVIRKRKGGSFRSFLIAVFIRERYGWQS
jgi:hypothetical protein